MQKSGRFLQVTTLLIALLLGIIALRPMITPEVKAAADSGQFDFVTIISPVYLYKGNQGVLLLDRRNGNVWFIGKGQEMEISYKDPVFVVRLPLEKLKHPPL